MIDTQTKRRSVHGYTGTLVYPLVDGIIGAGDRAHVAWIYSGLTYAPPAPEPIAIPSVVTVGGRGGGALLRKQLVIIRREGISIDEDDEEFMSLFSN
jgi:hypothetical protein